MGLDRLYGSRNAQPYNYGSDSREVALCLTLCQPKPGKVKSNSRIGDHYTYSIRAT